MLRGRRNVNVNNSDSGIWIRFDISVVLSFSWQDFILIMCLTLPGLLELARTTIEKWQREYLAFPEQWNALHFYIEVFMRRYTKIWDTAANVKKYTRDFSPGHWPCLTAMCAEFQIPKYEFLGLNFCKFWLAVILYTLQNLNCCMSS